MSGISEKNIQRCRWFKQMVQAMKQKLKCHIQIMVRNRTKEEET